MFLEQFAQIRQIWRGFHTLQFIEDLAKGEMQIFRKFFYQIPYAMEFYGKSGWQRGALNCIVQSMKLSFYLLRTFFSIIVKRTDNLPQTFDGRALNIPTSGNRGVRQHFIQFADLLKRAAGIHRYHLPPEHKDFTERGKLFLLKGKIVLGRHSGAQAVNVLRQTLCFRMRSIDQEYQYSACAPH